MERFDPAVRKLARDGWWRDVLDALHDQGWRLTLAPGGHIRATPPDRAKPIVFMPATPSCSRSRANSLADLRRSGLVYP